MSEKKRVEGLIVKRRDNAPDFVVVSLSFKKDDFAKTLQEEGDNGWLNLQVKKSKDGKLYADFDNWKPNASKEDLP
jgi:hypothetical protein